ncbi:tripartite tricarboxylate transporter TctB family protein [Bacillus dakarensis]|uniref:tripartite tricarboxylate transporter TctB family protein n=1 Tax=Robertmurraya dakarensis TaxID=1926278 RepID=UPI0009816F89|nr:tripartite tricarboxylate transporter TctB family protein [Bacillus dakarensis]
MSLKLDDFIGIIVIILSAFLYFLTNDLPEQSAFFPKYLIILFGVLGVILFFQSFKNKREQSKESSFSMKNLKDPSKALGLLIVYVILINLIGFFIATTMFVVVFMVVFKEKSFKKVVLTAVLLDAFLYVLFVYQLNVPLP